MGVEMSHVGIRATNPAGFRSGDWAVVTGVEWVNGRACYRVEFPDGDADSWVISDPSDPYEFRAPQEKSPRCEKCRSTDIYTQYDQNGYACPWSSRVEDGTAGEHLHRRCRGCGFGWGDPIAVPS